MFSHQLILRNGVMIRPALMRGFTVTKVTSPMPRRHASQLVPNIVAHSVQLPSCVSLSSMLYSPLGTIMLIALAYNVVVIGTKHFYYTMELTGKDYVQDQLLHQVMRYGILCCILLSMEMLFVEV
ncbi:hypothetical protein TRVL_05186 [Trypanosoma vivax]|uniref:Uncharacterized protein n=1 Tax=Trypanosoma vivax (strain Y486) TaxID=1055687 RepID=F9WVA7_TRYVY|nr:hypothetical protein TRVL_05186 [Trypanosoma vivax]CCD21514.1 hypothetical protein, conserved [Trypanosoma vivax Y486]|eukprot:CCD21514.1 hypothetical protein, conserved [Trypanosoma vivax Y486]